MGKAPRKPDPRKQLESAYDRLYALYESGEISPEDTDKLYDLDAQLRPGWEAQAARDEAMSQPMMYDPEVGVPGLGILPVADPLYQKARRLAEDYLPYQISNNLFGRPASQDFLDREGLLGVTGVNLATRLGDAPRNSAMGNPSQAGADLAMGTIGLLGLAPGGRAAKEAVEGGVNAVRNVVANPPARVAEFLADESGALPLPPLSNAQRTQIAGTFPTYRKALGLLDTEIPEGRTLDFGAGLGMSRDLGFDTYEPFPRAGFDPTYRSAADIPDASYDRLTNLNVLNVVPREVRDQIVSDIGRVLKPGGVGVVTTRGRDVMTAKGAPGPEPMSVITSADTYQKGFSQRELQEYLQSILGEAYGVSPVRLGPAGAMIRRNY